jgi:hypothetical protein
VFVECVVARTVDVRPRFIVIIFQYKFCVDGDFSSREYGTFTPSGLNLLGYAGVVVVGAMLRWNVF